MPKLSRCFICLFRRAAGWFPLTPAGLALAVAAIVLFRYGAVQHQDLLLAMAIPVLVVLLLTAVLLTVLAALLARIAIRKQRTTDGLELEVGVPSTTGFCFWFPRWFPLVEVSVAWGISGEVILQREGHHLAEVIVPERRGVLDVLHRSFTLRDAMGLVRVRWPVTELVNVRVLPAQRTIDPLRIPPAFATGDELSDPTGALKGDLADMRRYAPGDSPRLILWKIYARTCCLMVRRPEPALQEGRKLCLWFVPGFCDEEAAAVARAAVEQRLFGDNWLLAAEGVPGEAETVPASLDILVRSASTGPWDVDAFSAFRDFAARARSRGVSGCIVIGPESRRQALELLAAAASMPAQVLLAGSPRANEGTWWQRLLFVPTIGRTSIQDPLAVQLLETGIGQSETNQT